MQAAAWSSVAHNQFSLQMIGKQLFQKNRKIKKKTGYKLPCKSKPQENRPDIKEKRSQSQLAAKQL
jgi:hypothetical protein